MTDRELLELAAKAAGIDAQFEPWSQKAMVLAAPRGFCIYWNPLEDDGDALRLAMAAGVGISKPSLKFTNVRRAFVSDLEVFSATDDDPMAATRRAIVLAAASKVAP